MIVRPGRVVNRPSFESTQSVMFALAVSMSWHPISHNRIIPKSLDQEMQATT